MEQTQNQASHGFGPILIGTVLGLNCPVARARRAVSSRLACSDIYIKLTLNLGGSTTACKVKIAQMVHEPLHYFSLSPTTVYFFDSIPQ